MHQDIFISVDKLKILKESKSNIIIFDSSFYLPNSDKNAIAEYKREHIDGAVFFDIDQIAEPSSQLPHMFPSKKIFTEKMQNLGLNKNDHVIIYDNSSLSSARCWFLLRYFGHTKISILKGGLNQWKKNGGQTSAKRTYKKKGNFVSSEENISLVTKLEEMKNISISKVYNILDARSHLRFSGLEKEPRPGLPSGHIPNSNNLPLSNLINSQGFLISNKEFKLLLKNLMIKEDDKIIATCGSGVSACVIALAFFCIGNKNISIFDGSWTEWASNNLKIET